MTTIFFDLDGTLTNPKPGITRSIQYALQLSFLLTFLLGSMAGVAMLHTWRNLAHLVLRPGRCDPVFAGDVAHFRVIVETPSQARFAIGLRRRDEEPVHADVTPKLTL